MDNKKDKDQPIRYRCRNSLQVELFKKKIVFCYLACQYFDLKPTRRFWIHPHNNARYENPPLATIMQELSGDKQKFKDFFGMSQETYDELAKRITPIIRGKTTTMRQPVPPSDMLAVTIRYLVSGASISDLHRTFRVGCSTVSHIIRKTCTGIVKLLSNECFPSPTTNRWLEIAARFEEITKFPLCIGAVSQKQLKLRRGGHIITMYIVSDCDYNIIHYDIKDFTESEFAEKLLNDELNVPENAALNSSDLMLPYVLVSDGSVPCSPRVMTPFISLRKNVDSRTIYNERLAKVQRHAESTFGLITNKWKIFHRPIDVEMECALNVIQASCVLHNYVLQRDGYDFENLLTVEGFTDYNRSSVGSGRGNSSVTRNGFATHFENETTFNNMWNSDMYSGTWTTNETMDIKIEECELDCAEYIKIEQL